jgi:hypothetical protein
MNEQEIRDSIKTAEKSPSIRFTDNVMNDILSAQNVKVITYKWQLRLLLIACCIIIISSIFIRLPEIKLLSYTFGFSSVITPILSLIFLFIVFKQLFDLRDILIETNKNNVVQQHLIRNKGFSGFRGF